jgi:hypothetical protein
VIDPGDSWGTGERFTCERCGQRFVRLYSDRRIGSAVDYPLADWRPEWTPKRLIIDVDPMSCDDCEE